MRRTFTSAPITCNGYCSSSRSSNKYYSIQKKQTMSDRVIEVVVRVAAFVLMLLGIALIFK